jgi:hypothetical protein
MIEIAAIIGFLGAFDREFILELVELASRLGRDCNIWWR